MQLKNEKDYQAQEPVVETASYIGFLFPRSTNLLLRRLIGTMAWNEERGKKKKKKRKKNTLCLFRLGHTVNLGFIFLLILCKDWP